MTIRDIIRKGKGSAGSDRSWEVIETNADGITIKHLYHYSTKMLTWRDSDPCDEDYLDYSIGWGSVSDQNGMNIAFRELSIPLRYDRAGDASIRAIRSSVYERA